MTHICSTFSFLVSGTRQSDIDAKLLKDGKPLSPKDVEVIVHDDKIIFNIKKPAHDLSGKYQIKLKNAQGEDTKDVHINMQGIFPCKIDISSRFCNFSAIFK